MWIYFVCNYTVNLGLQYYLTFKLGYGIVGLWIAKIAAEILIVTLAGRLVLSRDWHLIAKESKDRQIMLKR